MATYLLCDRGFVPTTTAVVDAATARRVRYSENLRAAEDTDFAIRLFLDGQRFIMAEAPGAVWKRRLRYNRTSSGRKGGRMMAWLEEMRPSIPARAYYGCRGWAIAKSVAMNDPAAALQMYLAWPSCAAAIRGAWPGSCSCRFSCPTGFTGRCDAARFPGLARVSGSHGLEAWVLLPACLRLAQIGAKESFRPLTVRQPVGR